MSMILTCRCGQKNRLSDGARIELARCGKCKQALVEVAPQETVIQANETIKESEEDICGWCKNRVNLGAFQCTSCGATKTSSGVYGFFFLAAAAMLWTSVTFLFGGFFLLGVLFFLFFLASGYAALEYRGKSWVWVKRVGSL
jgi:hypothetical protein